MLFLNLISGGINAYATGYRRRDIITGAIKNLICKFCWDDSKKDVITFIKFLH